jgi:hypothetical protein
MTTLVFTCGSFYVSPTVFLDCPLAHPRVVREISIQAIGSSRPQSIAEASARYGILAQGSLRKARILAPVRSADG